MTSSSCWFSVCIVVSVGVCMIICAVVDGSPNVVRGNTAYQPAASDTYVAGLAVDGNNDTDVSNGHCSQSLELDNPWWGVRLIPTGAKTKTCVEYVIITTSNSASDSLSNFLIGVNTARQNLAMVAPTVGEYGHLCANYSGAIQPGTTVRINCARHVEGIQLVIQAPGPGRNLTLCEVQVHNSTKCYPENTAQVGPSETGPSVVPSSMGTVFSASVSKITWLGAIIFVLLLTRQ